MDNRKIQAFGLRAPIVLDSIRQQGVHLQSTQFQKHLLESNTKQCGTNSIDKNQAYIHHHANYGARYTSDRCSNQDEQVITINNRKYIRSKSPTNSLSPATRVPHIGDHNWTHPAQTDMKLRILESHVPELHQWRQSEYLQIMAQNSRLVKQLQQQRTKANTAMKQRELFTPIKKIGEQEQYFAEHESRIQNMKKRIMSLEGALDKAQLVNVGLQEANDNLSESIDQYRSRHKLSGQQNQKSATQTQSKYMQQPTENNSHSGDRQVVAVQYQLTQLKQDNKAKALEIVRQQIIIDNYETTTKQLEQKTHELYKIITDLEQQIADLHEQAVGQRKSTLRPIVKFAESESISLADVGADKLQNVSMGFSIMMGDQSCNLYNKAGQECQQQQQYIDLDGCGNESLANILEKIELLTESNDKIVAENLTLSQTLSEMSAKNASLILELQSTQYDLDLKQREMHRYQNKKTSLVQSSASRQIYNDTSRRNQDLELRNIDLEKQLYILTMARAARSKDCDKCRALTGLINKLSSRVGCIEQGPHSY